ncbi:hypothetical protein MBM_00714 [Drepanopeziza brunnea f. sp. 'multigermtubi' MB_m1]|uniref:Uncharacterized protein n=1 Tax=Marssonina brunnea f. sp. multigermtubi (strain MB_m1) TaxID=1072389 RepID=K1X945_MARBU|nr:uncharacterized protein MBM_00714 [Drepanopeziza brunnea f. sp. 'multigermtubi' MB_m1]EKD21601.1 hypothetical protein MBM_00714 [Drepanopeziza brunnea f. sp. 'multigermtubi' MB_m1]
MQFFFKSVLLRGGVTQSNRIVKRGRGRLRNLFFALAIAAVIAAAAAAAILRTLTSEASLFSLDPLIKRLLMLTIVKALRCIKCINSKITSRSNKDCYNCDTSVIRCLRCAKGSYSNCTAAFAAINTAFDNFVSAKDSGAIQRVRRDAALLRGAANGPGGLASGSRGFRSNPGSFAGFALAFKTFNLNVAFVRLNGLVAANRSPVTRSASSILPFPAFALAALVAFVAFVALVALAALVVLVALIVVAPFALVVAPAALAAAPAVAMTLAERRAKVKRLLRALVDLLL